jgi:hypothetical protein
MSVLTEIKNRGVKDSFKEPGPPVDGEPCVEAWMLLCSSRSLSGWLVEERLIWASYGRRASAPFQDVHFIRALTAQKFWGMPAPKACD